MPITKEEKLQIIADEQARLEHGLYSAQLDVAVSEASPGDVARLESARNRLADVTTRIEALAAIRKKEEAE